MGVCIGTFFGIESWGGRVEEGDSSYVIGSMCFFGFLVKCAMLLAMF